MGLLKKILSGKKASVGNDAQTKKSDKEKAGIEIGKKFIPLEEKELWLGSSDLTSLPDSIGELTELTGLGLSNNKLTTLPESIGNLKKLTWLAVSNNQLTSIPEWIGNLGRLEELNLSGNQLTSISEWIGKCKSLRKLDLSYNQLNKTFPDSLKDIKSLRKLKLAGNGISYEQSKSIEQMLPNVEIDWAYEVSVAS